jgi:hypothetical protein
MTDYQRTLDGREEALPAVAAGSKGRVVPEPLFAGDAFSARVPGTLAMDADPDA